MGFCRSCMPAKEKDKIRIKRKAKRHSDPKSKVKENMRKRLREALKNSKKKDRTINLTGCTWQELNDHLESQFVDGMGWHNYGRSSVIKGERYWEIDHIMPCAIFDFDDPAQQEECCHYANLRPLWADLNRKKGSKLLIA